ncbi:MAG: NAD(P)/FAD-dependent oxidoreductase [Cytophagales bacterium]|nr:NAD(P)/FAD-dependent oxidoreductase [Cytophagales bacterium]
MTRQEFIQKAAMAGLGLPLISLLSSCEEDNITPNEINVNFSGNVLIIGAGSAGLMAGHFLQQNGINFQILEASSVYGGRVKRADSFVDFPIDLGAEWIHTDPSILADLVNDPSVQASIDIINYRPEEIHVWKNNQLRKRNFFSNFYAEHKFKSTTWYGFFEQYILPGIADRITYDTQVTNIDYSGTQITVTDQNSNSYTADKIILTVPLTVLQNDVISFTPALPTSKTDALNNVEMPSGIKVFVEFSEKFYPDIVFDGGLLEQNDELGEKVYYNAAFRKDSDRNVFALFAVGDPAKEYTDQGSDENIFNYLMAQWDEIFDGKATQHYQNHVIQNWLAEPFIGGSYSHYGSNRSGTIATLQETIDNKVYFAGEAYHDDWQATVHGAGLSAYEAVRTILEGN